MDAKRRAVVIRDLLAGKGLTKPRFDVTYSAENRRWLVSAVVDQILNDLGAPSDDKVPAVAAELLNNANWAVALERDSLFDHLVLDDPLTKILRKDTARRVEILYGIIAENKTLADTTTHKPVGFTGMRRFLMQRRYRGVMRMVYQVNPNTLGFMWYPDRCKTPPLRLQVNVDAAPFWVRADPNFSTPLKVKTGSDPLTAVKKIWGRPFPKDTEICSANLFDCSNAACCILLDTLHEAFDPDSFYASIEARGAEHLLIINPNLRSEQHCLWDEPDEPKRVFSKVLVEDKHFQVGDHVVIENHGLYASVVPGGFWVAEHSFVTNTGNRSLDSARGVLFAGHGVDQPFTINVLYDDLIKTIHTRLHRTFKMAELFLRFRKTPTSIPPGQVVPKMAQDVVDPRSGASIKVDAFQITFDVHYDNFNKPPKDGRRPRIREGESGNPLVMFDIPSLKQIAIAPPTIGNTIDTQLARFAVNARMTFLKRDPETGGSHYYDPAFWKIMFHNSNTDKDDLFPVFGGKNASFKLLERKDMPKGDGRYFRGGHPASEKGALITRPTAETTNLYLDELAKAGGIRR